MLKIETITAFVGTDDHGQEGIIGRLFGDQWMPFVAADLTRLKQLLPVAVDLYSTRQDNFKILQFSVRTDITSQYMKTSEEWYNQKYAGKTKIIDPDGWDRSNWGFSWYEEIISEMQFELRFAASTIHHIPNKPE